MISYPKTKRAARAYVYGLPSIGMTHAYVEHHCAFEVWPNERGPVPHQCFRNNGHGPAALYCKQHAREVERHG